MTPQKTHNASDRKQPAAGHKLFFDHAFLPNGWARNVRLSVVDGIIANVEIDAERGDSTYVKGLALPGLPNLHCHTFQRGMAGLSERRGRATTVSGRGAM